MGNIENEDKESKGNEKRISSGNEERERRGRAGKLGQGK